MSDILLFGAVLTIGGSVVTAVILVPFTRNHYAQAGNFVLILLGGGALLTYLGSANVWYGVSSLISLVVAGILYANALVHGDSAPNPRGEKP